MMKSKRNHSTNINTKATNKRLRTELNKTDEDIVDGSDESLVKRDEVNTGSDTSTDSLPRNKSNVWNYAYRDRSDPRQRLTGVGSDYTDPILKTLH